MMRREKGTTTVEFSIVGATFFLLLFGALEVGRLFYTLHALTEGTRRGARVAAVCGPFSADEVKSAIQTVAAYGDPGDGGGLISSIEPDNFEVEYLTGAGGEPATFLDIRYVRVSVVNYKFQFIVPGFSNAIMLPSLSTTLPRESLGVPREGDGAECPPFY